MGTHSRKNSNLVGILQKCVICFIYKVGLQTIGIIKFHRKLVVIRTFSPKVRCELVILERFLGVVIINSYDTI